MNELDRRLQEETARPFDLARAPLLRVTLLRFDEQNHGLLLAMHDIVSDACSNPFSPALTIRLATNSCRPGVNMLVRISALTSSKVGTSSFTPVRVRS